ncbi:acyltransferase family protein [Paenibacillus arenilitoris]|uniref:Acyltransferase family protein n=1 Tax=Paenibacillus arenilitoris TaxID=2772299 RepID=A0A927CRE0_9BACL|nr:acyltransferase family protein [Paenibacillus arenilitoris]MBD2872758.1 acyltransferase family protein [Paenibacillus arenilitoris]
MRNYYPGITIFKLSGSLLVLFAHLFLIRYMAQMPAQSLVQFVSLATRIVVPCFYVVAGFLAYKGWSRAASPKGYVVKYAARIGIVYAFFCLLFIAESIVPKLISDGLTAGNLFLQAKVLFMTFFLNGPFIQFWFIPPLVFGVTAAYLLLRRQRDRLAMYLTLAFFAAVQFVSGSFQTAGGEAFGAFAFLQPDHAEYLVAFATRYFGFGFTFVVAGALLAKYEERFLSVKIKPLLLASIALTVLETAALFRYTEWTTDYKLTIGALPNTVLLFYGILRIRSRAAGAYHRQISLFSAVTFFTHILLMKLNLYMLGWSVDSMHVWQDLVYLMLTLLECIAITVLIGLSSKRLPARQAGNLPS